MQVRPRALPGLLLIGLAALAACTNDPYPEEDRDLKILYRAFDSPPKTLDPAVAYSTIDHEFTGVIYDTLLEYHYLDRPYRLIPGLAEAVPSPEILADGRVRYRFDLRKGLLFHDDPSFQALGGQGATREVTAEDLAFELMRIADPAVASPIISNFRKISGFAGFTARLRELRESDPEIARLTAKEQYRRAGGVAGLRVAGDHRLEIILDEPYPQLLYWFAMPFTTPVPWEAVAYYDGEEGRDHFRDHPVGTGPYRLTVYDKQHKIRLDRNPNWYGRTHREWNVPGAVFPASVTEAESAGLDPAYRGRALPFIDRIEFRREKETIPAFTKFLQGYYDLSGIIRESFDTVIHEGALSKEMAAQGMQLQKTVSPTVFYIGFNMDDPLVGHGAGERGRKLRQAMSLVIDSAEYLRVFTNGRGVPAQSPLPPGIFGYDGDYRNPYRQVDRELARDRLVEAGYPGGIDPETGKPLRLTFDTPDTSARGFLRDSFFVAAWRTIGLDVEIKATNYNQFQDKVRKGAYQLFVWGWQADYPDPENFLFLLESSNSRTKSGGPNSANFSDAGYDALFAQVKDMENSDARLALITEMRAILERERPWIELNHREVYKLYQGWLKNVRLSGLSNPTVKYHDLDPGERAGRREERNQPVLWPGYLLFFVGLAVLLPGIATYYRERQ